MKILFFSVKDFELQYLNTSTDSAINIEMTDQSLSIKTAAMAEGATIISVFTGDDVSATVLESLYKNGVRFITTRAAGYDNIDIIKASSLGIVVANIPAYSPYAIAEHALALILALNRKLILSNKRVHEHDFTVGNLIGFDLHGKTVGIIGTGRIGSTLVKILQGFGCRLLAYDIHQDYELAKKYDLEYVPLPVLCREANIISLHTALTPQTKHLIDSKMIRLMQKGVMIINTCRGACVNTEDILNYLE
ncbi:MAG: NAD(P)-dependent oxidoreductase, partial [Chitinophagaceae bacterium]